MEEQVRSGGAVLAVERFGRAERGSIVLVMGATASMLWWPDALCEALAATGYQVIRFDLRDTGRSSTAPAGELTYGLRDLADDVIAVLDACELTSAHLVGMSLGGLLGQINAIAYPERVVSLTLIAAEPLGMDYDGAGIAPEFLQHFASMQHLDWSDRAAVSRFLLTIARLSAGSVPGFNADAATSRIAAEMARAPSLQSAFNHAMLAGELPPAFRADALRLPVLIMHGTEDPIINFAAAQAIASAVPGARLVALPGRGHEIAPEDVPRFAAEIGAFVREVDATKATQPAKGPD